VDTFGNGDIIRDRHFLFEYILWKDELRGLHRKSYTAKKDSEDAWAWIHDNLRWL